MFSRYSSAPLRSKVNNFSIKCNQFHGVKTYHHLSCNPSNQFWWNEVGNLREYLFFLLHRCCLTCCVFLGFLFQISIISSYLLFNGICRVYQKHATPCQCIHFTTVQLPIVFATWDFYFKNLSSGRWQKFTLMLELLQGKIKCGESHV